MTNLVPDCFDANRYKWILSSCIRSDDDILRVYFETNAEYEQTLQNPFELAAKAKSENCNELFLYVVGQDKPRIKLITDSVVGLGRLQGFFGFPSGHACDREPV